MRGRCKVRLKVLCYLILFSSFLLFVSRTDFDNINVRKYSFLSSEARKVASIDSEDLEVMLKDKQIESSDSISYPINESMMPGIPRWNYSFHLFQDVHKTKSTALLVLEASTVVPEASPVVLEASPVVPEAFPVPIGCDSSKCQKEMSTNAKLSTFDGSPLAHISAQYILSIPVASTTDGSLESQGTRTKISEGKELHSLKNQGLNCKNNDCKTSKPPFVVKSRSRGYSNRVSVERVTFPTEWADSPDLFKRLQERRDHVKRVCQKYGLDKRSEENQPNSWEFLINERFGLVWCSIFKAASSTWFYNFNILAGYSDHKLMSTKETPVTLARKKYPRPSVKELDRVMNSTRRPLTFMIVRHPLERLVSAFRDKLQSGSRFYRSLSRNIISAYPDLGPREPLKVIPIEDQWDKGKTSRDSGITKKAKLKYIVPSFSQFVQFVIDSAENGVRLDEHWSPMTSFCTPCIVDFDIFIKVENLDEEGNYIIFKSGIENLIQPKRINKSKNEPTNEVAKSYLCNLSENQIKRLINLYKMDLEIFNYKIDDLLNCTKSSFNN